MAAAEARLAAAGVPAAEIDARLLMAHVLGVKLPAVSLARARPITAGDAAAYDALVAARATRRPLQHLLGEVEFYGRPFVVTPGVLIPRPETEQLVAAVLAMDTGDHAMAADVGSGSGVVGLTLAAERPGLRLLCLDSSAGARALTAANARRLGLASRVAVLAADLLAPIAGGALDLVVSNPPYVPSAEIPRLEPEVRDHDPHAALDGGPDGLRSIARLLADAARVLRPGGQLAVEFGDGQADQVYEMAQRAGFAAIERRPDLSGRPRVLVARRPR